MKTILETRRLLLRELLADDAEAVARIICDPLTMRYYPTPFTRADADEWVARNQRRYQANGHGLWAVVRRASGELIGDCGVTLQEVGAERLPEIGYHLRRDMWGQGFATEAARACFDWGFNHLRTEFLISLIRPENLPSRRVAERNGLTVWKQAIRQGLVHDVFRIHRGEWERLRAKPSG